MLRTRSLQKSLSVSLLLLWLICVGAPIARALAPTSMPVAVPSEDFGDEDDGWAEAMAGDEDEGDAEADAEAEADFDADSEAGEPGDTDEEALSPSPRASEQQALVNAEEQRRIALLHTEVDHPDIEIDATLGYDGVIGYGRAMPIAVTLRNAGGDLDGSVCLNLYQGQSEYDRVEYPLYLAAGAEKTITLKVTLSMKQPDYTIEYCVDGAVVASKNFRPAEAIGPEVRLIGALSSDPTGLSYMSLSARNDPLLRGEYFRAIPLTAERFPDDLDRLSAFSLLVVDGVDLRTLGEAQAKALGDWLGAGGIAIVGGGAGAASGYPFFESFTGIRAGELQDAADITPALMAYLGVSEAALGENMLCVDMTGADHVLAAPDRPLIAQTSVGKGLIYTAAFELGAKPLSLWPGAPALWQRVLLKSAPDAYQRTLAVGYDGWGYNADYDGINAVREIPVDNPPDALPVKLLLIVFVALAGIPSYFLLKKLDKRTLMWLTMPLLAVVAALFIWGISRNAGFDGPVATVYTLAALDEDGSAQVSTYAGISSADKVPVTVSVGTGVELTPIDQPNYDYYENANQIKTPNQLRYRYLHADTPAITFPAAPSWSERTVKLDAPQPFDGTIDARIWMEEDGLHAEIRNDTPYRLNGCGIITSAGYASMPDLEPGATGQAALTYLTDAERKQLKDAQAARMNGGYTPLTFDGRMTDASLSAQGSDPIGDIYRFVDALYTPEENVADPAVREANMRRNANDPAAKERRMRRDRLQQRVYLWGGEDQQQAAFRFVAFSEDLGNVTPTCGGRPAERIARRALIDKAMAYDPVGPTGVVFYPRGTLTPHKASLVGGAPTIGDALGDRQSFSLAEQPMFAFELPKGMTVDELSIISVLYGEPMPKAQLYNHETRAWDEQRTAFVSLKGEAAAPYIGPDGRLYVGYVPGENTSGSGYYELQAPGMTLTGRVTP